MIDVWLGSKYAFAALPSKTGLESGFRWNLQYQASCGKCPNTEVFQVRIFLYSSLIRENTDQKNYWNTFHVMKVKITVYNFYKSFYNVYKRPFITYLQISV